MAVADILHDRCYYRMLGDRDLLAQARASEDHLVQILVDKWWGAKDAYADEHGAEVNELNRECDDLQAEIERLNDTIANLESQLDEKDEHE